MDIQTITIKHVFRNKYLMKKIVTSNKPITKRLERIFSFSSLFIITIFTPCFSYSYEDITIADWILRNRYPYLLLDKLKNDKHLVVATQDTLPSLCEVVTTNIPLFKSIYKLLRDKFPCHKVKWNVMVQHICQGGNTELLEFILSQYKTSNDGSSSSSKSIISDDHLVMSLENGRLLMANHLIAKYKVQIAKKVEMIKVKQHVVPCIIFEIMDMLYRDTGNLVVAGGTKQRSGILDHLTVHYVETIINTKDWNEIPMANEWILNRYYSKTQLKEKQKIESIIKDCSDTRIHHLILLMSMTEEWLPLHHRYTIYGYVLNHCGCVDPEVIKYVYRYKNPGESDCFDEFVSNCINSKQLKILYDINGLKSDGDNIMTSSIRNIAIYKHYVKRNKKWMDDHVRKAGLIQGLLSQSPGTDISLFKAVYQVESDEVKREILSRLYQNPEEYTSDPDPKSGLSKLKIIDDYLNLVSKEILKDALLDVILKVDKYLEEARPKLFTLIIHRANGMANNIIDHLLGLERVFWWDSLIMMAFLANNLEIFERCCQILREKKGMQDNVPDKRILEVLGESGDINLLQYYFKWYPINISSITLDSFEVILLNAVQHGRSEFVIQIAEFFPIHYQSIKWNKYIQSAIYFDRMNMVETILKIVLNQNNHNNNQNNQNNNQNNDSNDNNDIVVPFHTFMNEFVLYFIRGQPVEKFINLGNIVERMNKYLQSINYIPLFSYSTNNYSIINSFLNEEKRQPRDDGKRTPDYYTQRLDYMVGNRWINAHELLNTPTLIESSKPFIVKYIQDLANQT